MPDIEAKELANRFSIYPESTYPSMVFSFLERQDLWDSMDLRVYLSFPLEKSTALPKEVIKHIIEKHLSKLLLVIHEELQGKEKTEGTDG
jgi:hypothetical protein